MSCNETYNNLLAAFTRLGFDIQREGITDELRTIQQGLGAEIVDILHSRCNGGSDPCKRDCPST